MKSHHWTHELDTKTCLYWTIKNKLGHVLSISPAAYNRKAVSQFIVLQMRSELETNEPVQRLFFHLGRASRSRRKVRGDFSFSCQMRWVTSTTRCQYSILRSNNSQLDRTMESSLRSSRLPPSAWARKSLQCQLCLPQFFKKYIVSTINIILGSVQCTPFHTRVCEVEGKKRKFPLQNSSSSRRSRSWQFLCQLPYPRMLPNRRRRG